VGTDNTELTLTVASMLFLVGSLAFVALMIVGKGVPRIPLIL
jgi:hypothetical protein